MNKIKSLKNIFHTSGTKHGAYSVGLTVLVIAVVIVFNLIVGQIPEAYRNLDVSSTKIYDISDTTTELLDGLDGLEAEVGALVADKLGYSVCVDCGADIHHGRVIVWDILRHRVLAKVVFPLVDFSRCCVCHNINEFRS